MEAKENIRSLKFIAGPCVIESAELLDTVASKLVSINERLGVDIIFKASFDKANRTSIHSFRGPGIGRGLQMLAAIKKKYGLKLLTDIHEAWQAEPVGEVVDVIQIPAFPARVFGVYHHLGENRRIAPLRVVYEPVIAVRDLTANIARYLLLG